MNEYENKINVTKQNNLCGKCGNKLVSYMDNEKGIKIYPPWSIYYTTYQDILICLKKRKLAIIRQCEECKSIEMECPYCHNKTIIDTVDTTFICSSCFKKSHTYTEGRNPIIYGISKIKEFTANNVVKAKKKG